ncbi:alpha/beta hydrolase [Nocardia salmonicida]
MDALAGGMPAFDAHVAAVDLLHDLAVLTSLTALPKSIEGWAATDSVILSTDTIITGVVEVPDHEYTYRFLDAPGRWEGGTTRDEQVRLGRVKASTVMRGMSGGPVRRASDDFVVGVVSARYNSVDGWGRDSVFVARIENLQSLLEGIVNIEIAGPLPLRSLPVIKAETVPATSMLVEHDLVFVNMQEQATFHPFEFQTSSLNLHKLPGSRKSQSVIVFVHGLNGNGYSTWGDFPSFIYHNSVGVRIDIAVFDYFSGHRRRFKSRANVDGITSLLAERLSQLARLYDEIYIVAHSMGGLVARDAIKKYVDVFDRPEGLKPIAGLIQFDTPLEGSGWSPRMAQIVFTEARILHRWSKYQIMLRKYFDNHFDVHDSSNLGNRAYLMPIYAGYAELDSIVTKESATAGIPERQCYGFQTSHSDIVKPQSSNDEQVKFVLNAVIRTTENRAIRRVHWMREKRDQGTSGQPESMETRPSKPSDLLITDVFLDPDAVYWKQIYDEVLRSVSNTYPRVQVVDIATVAYDWKPELLLSIHDSSRIRSGDPGSIELVRQVRKRYDELDSETRLVSFGSENEHAIPRISAAAGLDGIGGRPLRRRIMIDSAEDDDELRQRLHIHVETLVTEIENRLNKPKDRI